MVKITSAKSILLTSIKVTRLILIKQRFVTVPRKTWVLYYRRANIALVMISVSLTSILRILLPMMKINNFFSPCSRSLPKEPGLSTARSFFKKSSECQSIKYCILPFSSDPWPFLSYVIMTQLVHPITAFDQMMKAPTAKSKLISSLLFNFKI